METTLNGGQLGWKGSDQFYEDSSLLDEYHWQRQQMASDVGCWTELDAAHCQEASVALLIAISFFWKTD
ncbi:hypothetical protein B9Z55_009390 [Caenorhabditis nigoni]|uniref:Uncharacterized protein n=1 Tax=Caenorhabditis nigoni TaxID=1611254 RepID=A0A2G5URT5_9PELO|nr:hypothetical protein B9Z55_009390 [Caenorhabditis nigoni]